MGRLEKRDVIPLGRPRLARAGAMHRVEADVDGTTVWFESSDIGLRPSVEAFASAFVIPGLARGARLIVDAPADPIWLSNQDRLQAILRKWWRYPMRPPQAVADVLQLGRNGDGRGTGETVLFFSGGTDSFYTLLKSGLHVNRLLLMQGFDYPLDDKPRHAAALQTLREVAAARGLRADVVRTNAREHALYQDVSWERVHGGLLAAVGHVLDDAVSEVIISSSISYQFGRPWGSHWQVDPLWGSTSRRFVSFGQHFRKLEKLMAVAHEPLLFDRLRVCWANDTRTGNCSRCRKCVYARLVLHAVGQLDNYSVFEGPASLVESLDALPRAGQRARTYTDLVDQGVLEPEVEQAVRRLLQRTRRLNSAPIRMRRAVIRKVSEWMRVDS